MKFIETKSRTARMEGGPPILILFLLFILPIVLCAQKDNEWHKVLAEETSDHDHFGKSVAISGNFAIVGAWTEDEKGPEAGAAYIYSRTDEKENWKLVQKITASDGSSFNHFGQVVLINETFVVVGAQGNNEFAGSVYLFKRPETPEGTWKEVKKITATDGERSDFFGSSIAMANGVLVVGAYGDDDLGRSSGSVYIFEQNRKGVDQWGEICKLNSNSMGAGDHFGISVATDGKHIVVGADGDNRMGALFIYKKEELDQGQWQPVQQIFASDGKVNDRFAHSVTVLDNCIVAGADRSEGKMGAVYVFDKDLGGPDNWGEVQKIVPEDGMANDRFGKQVALSKNYLIVGSEGHQLNQGAAYVYQMDLEKGNIWKSFDKLIAYDGIPNDLFACSVAIDEDKVIVGAVQGDEQGSNSGGIYLVQLRNLPELANKE